jgi:hypothetical protein
MVLTLPLVLLNCKVIGVILIYAGVEVFNLPLIKETPKHYAPNIGVGCGPQKSTAFNVSYPTVLSVFPFDPVLASLAADTRFF